MTQAIAIQLEPEELEPAPTRSHETLMVEWMEHLRGQAENTRRGRRQSMQSLFRAMPAGLHITELRRPHLVQYMEQNYGRCALLKAAGADNRPTCTKGLDLAGCGSKCRAWTPKTRDSFMVHMRGIKEFFGFLVHRGYIDANWTPDTIKQWARGIKWQKRPDEPGFRATHAQMKRFLSGLPLYRRAPCATMAKLGLRIHEMCMLRLADVDLESGWLTVPRGGKRMGNNVLPIDTELCAVLKAYEAWRTAHAKAGTTSYFLNHQGRDLAPAQASQSQLNRLWFQRDAVRLGLQAEGAEVRDRWHSHSMRHFYSDHLSEAGCPDPWYGVLRGDDVRKKTNRARYTDTARRERIRAYYAQYAPVVGIT